jgi:cytochrome oxidase assembly protein ShyY1
VRGYRRCVSQRVKFLLTPRWLVLHALTVLAVVLMIALGTWQFDSLEGSGGRDVPVPGDSATGTPNGLPDPGESLPRAATGSSASAAGAYEDDDTLLVPGRAVEGTPSGWLVMTPLVVPPTQAGTNDMIVPVVRGWVADPGPPRAPPPAVAPAGIVEVTGTVAALETDQAATRGPSATLRNGEVAALTAQNLFLELPYDPAQLVAALLVAESESPVPADEPVRAQPSAVAVEGEVGRWRHLAYGAQWWLFAAAALVFWGAFVRAGWQGRTPAQSAPPGDPAQQDRADATQGEDTVAARVEADRAGA